jgi:hypothetical protein
MRGLHSELLYYNVPPMVQPAASPHPQHGHRHSAALAPTASLLRLSAPARLAGVAIVVAAIWAAVAWAWS